VDREGRKYIPGLEAGATENAAAGATGADIESDAGCLAFGTTGSLPGARSARSVREGMAEMFTLQRLKLPPSLYRCLATTNPIESPQSGVTRRTANVKYWHDQGLVERWVASAWLRTENRFRKISGHLDLWALATIPGRKTETEIPQEKIA
jgi:hypothetical protein